MAGVEKRTCAGCGEAVQAYHRVGWCFFPARLVRKRQRDQEWERAYCLRCYDAASPFRFELGGRTYSFRPWCAATKCPGCGSEALVDGAMYGLLALAFVVNDSTVESGPLATFCAACADIGAKRTV